MSRASVFLGVTCAFIGVGGWIAPTHATVLGPVGALLVAALGVIAARGEAETTA